MYKTSIEQAPMFESDLPGAEGVGFGLLISVKDGAPNFVMERHVIAPGGHGAPHAHDWEQQMYVTAGHGVLRYTGPMLSEDPARVVSEVARLVTADMLRDDPHGVVDMVRAAVEGSGR